MLLNLDKKNEKKIGKKTLKNVEKKGFATTSHKGLLNHDSHNDSNNIMMMIK
jgi:hypothetical protein